MTYICSLCGDSYTEDIAETGHTAGETVAENIVAPTCTAAGSYDNVTYCAVCGEAIGRVTVTVEKLPHKAHQVVVENIVAPTCTQEGSYDNVTKCVCGEEISRVTVPVAALGHTAGSAVVENIVAPTCTQEGSYDNVTYCTVCSAELSRVTVPVAALGHTEGSVVVENFVNPDCVNTGSYDNVVYCTVCSAELSRETITTDAFGHKYSTTETAPDCENKGYTTYTCSVCGDSYADDYVPALGHEWDEGVVTKDPTYTETGVMTFTCGVCGDTRTEDIAKLKAVAYNENTDTYYGDFTEAVNAAVSGETVTVLADIEDTAASTVVIKKGVTLDLNGYMVKAGNFLSFGDVIDIAGNGGIAISENTAEAFTLLNTNNSYMPIYDKANGCYRVFKYTFTNEGAMETGSSSEIKFNFALVFENKEAYKLLAANPTSLTLTVDIKIDGTNTLNQVFTYTCDETLLSQYAIIKYAKDSDNLFIAFTVSGMGRLNEGASVSATPTISSVATGVTTTAQMTTYTK